MNILEKICLVATLLLLVLGIGIILGMFKSRDMCTSYAQRIACNETPITKYVENDCPECSQEIRWITEPCPLADPLENVYVLDLEETLKKAMKLIKTQRAVIEIQNKLNELE